MLAQYFMTLGFHTVATNMSCPCTEMSA